ncbi:hypothetical protein EVG20_g11135, partial [Dentipellis fragilis]
MSFQDIETGLAQRPHSPTRAAPQSQEDAAFMNVQSSLSLQVFKINANVQGMLKLVDQLGTPRDSASLRKSLHDLGETTRAMAKRGSEDLKKLAALQATLPSRKTPLQKTSHDFQLSLVAFQRAQQVSAERQRTVVASSKLAVEEEEHRQEDQTGTSPEQLQVQAMHPQLSPQELAYQESLITERETEIREIETGIHELSAIFRDLGTLVNEQGGMIDNIESNISSIAVDTSGAAEELTTAAEYQRKAGRRAACLMMILVIVVAIVLVALPSSISPPPSSRALLACPCIHPPCDTAAPGFFRDMLLDLRESVRADAEGSADPVPSPSPGPLRTRITMKLPDKAAFTVLIWDHMISFADEIQYVWKGNKGPRMCAVLGDVQRVLTPGLGWKLYTYFSCFIINIYGMPSSFMALQPKRGVKQRASLFFRFMDSTFVSCLWDALRFHVSYSHSCNRFVRYEGALTMIGIAVVALMMFLRIRALYHRQVWVQAFVFSIFLAFIGVNAWLLSFGEGVPHVPGNVRSCSMIFDHRAGSMAAASAWLPLLYDTVVLCLTLFRTIVPVWHRTSGQILRVILREGMMYYSVIFSVTLVLTIMILHAEPSVQNITAQLELLLTVTMMSRITIHLKRFAHYNSLGYAVTEPTLHHRPSSPGT